MAQKRKTIVFDSVGDWISARRPSFTEAELASALEEQVREPDTVQLSAGDAKFWAEHSGIVRHAGQVAGATAHNAVSSVVMDASALSAGDVAQLLGLSASTVRHYKASGKLYSYERRGRLHFPIWQFGKESRQVIPSLSAVLNVLPAHAHPQTISGFFLTPQPDLVIDGQPASAKEWLEAGGDASTVVEIAADLAAGY